MAIEKHDQVFLMGDLNFRIKELTKDEVFDNISKNNLSTILNKDGLILSGF